MSTPLGSVPHCHQQVRSGWIQLWAGSSKTRRVTNSTFTGSGQSEDVLKQQCTQEERRWGPRHTPLPPPPSSVSWQAGCGRGSRRGTGGRHAPSALGSHSHSFPPIQFSHSFCPQYVICKCLGRRKHRKGQRIQGQVPILVRAPF